jgi:hypothetical protein
MGRGGRSVGIAIYILMIVAFLFTGDSPGVRAWLSKPAVLAGLSLLSAALAWDALRTVFPAGGERHWKILSAQVRQQVSGDMRKTMKVKRAGGGRGRLYAFLLARDLQPGGHPEHLLLHALGPGNHRFDVVLPLLGALLAALAVKLGVTGSAPRANHMALQFFSCFAVPLILLQCFTFHRLVVSIDNTHGEQALVRLAPRAPRADRLGRSLARQLLGICLTEWLACGLGALAIMALFGGGARYMTLAASAMCASLAACGWALRDYSGKQPGALVEVIVQSVLVGAGVVALFLVRENLPMWTALALLMVGCAWAIGSERWKRMVSAPVQFPAGRFA